VLDAIVGVGGLLIALAQLFLQLQERHSASRPEPPRASRSSYPPASDWDDRDVVPRSSYPMEGDESSEDWSERWHREFEARAEERQARTASSLALLASVFLGIGSVAYVVATSTNSRSQSPAALAWGAAALGGIAAGLSGLAWLVWRQTGPGSRGAPMALLVLLAGGVLVIFALRLLSGSPA